MLDNSTFKPQKQLLICNSPDFYPVTETLCTLDLITFSLCLVNACCFYMLPAPAYPPVSVSLS